MLARGPLAPPELAWRIMSLRGPAHAAGAALQALLGPDPRFRLDPEGRWRLTREGPPLPPLDRLDYAVVDVETTGSLRWRGHGIVEIAVVHVSDGLVMGTWSALLDPGRPLPAFVTELTGITPDMVAGAPLFEHVAAQVHDLLEGRVFVAHNVGFDWGFVRSHLEGALGRVPDVPRLCTVHLARRMLPRLKRRNLDALAHHYGIEIGRRHRALDDALATARALVRLLDEARLQGAADLPTLMEMVRRRPGRRRPGRRAARKGTVSP